MTPFEPLKLIPVKCPMCAHDSGKTVARGKDYEYRTAEEEFTFIKCDSCGLIYLNPRPASEEMNRIYPDNYYAYDVKKRRNSLVTAIRNRMEKKKIDTYTEFIGINADVMDVGCGDGRLLKLMQEFGPKDWRLFGIDINENALKLAREAGFEVELARLENFDAGDKLFDLLTLFQVIEHVPDPRIMLQKMFDLLKPGGIVAIETPNLSGMDYYLFKRRYWGGYHFPRHFTLFTPVTLSQMMEKVGYDVLRREAMLSPVFWIHSMHNIADDIFLKSLANFFHYQNPLLLAFTTAMEIPAKMIGFTSNQRIIGQKPKS
jgi:SAM-dependent methyltransferase